MSTAISHDLAQDFELPLITPRDRLTRAGGWLTLVLALIMLGSVAEGLHAAGWSEGLEVVRLAIMGGGLVGFALALTRFDGLFAAFYGFAAGAFWVILSLQRVLLPAMGMHDAVHELLLRNAGWLMTLVEGGAGADNLVFVTQLAFLGWWLGFLATWGIFRHQQVLYAAVPAGIALLVNLYYSPLNLSGYLLVFLVTVLLLAVRIELARNETRWQLSRIRYAPDIYVDFLKAGFAFAAIVAVASWAMPDIASRANVERLLRPLQRPWLTIEDTWSRMYQSLNYPGVAPVTMRYGKNLTLGGPVSLSDRPIFEAQFPVRTYWRAATYNSYDGRGWTSTTEETTIVEHGRWLGEPLFSASAEMTATLRPLEAGQDVILAPPQPVQVSLPVDADTSRITDDGALVTVSRMRSRIELGSRSAYNVVSAVTQAPVNLLQADGTKYPLWVTGRYLQLPEHISQSVVELARSITALHANPYDKAVAIESFLRTYPYNTNIAAPSEGRDAVEYFLFDAKQGYCDYYASAMVVLLRVVGIPSRVAAGYAPGEMLPASDDKPMYTDTYRVLERDAHAWVEAFFPTYGWIQFEPTASQPLVQRMVVQAASTPQAIPTPIQEEDLRDLRNAGFPEGSQAAAQTQSDLLLWVKNRRYALGLTAGALVLTLIGAFGMWRRERTLLANPEVLAVLLERVGRWAVRLGIPWPVSHTPLEHATQFGREVPESEPIVNQMAGLFVVQLYGRQKAAPDSVRTVATEWRGLQPTLWRRWLLRMIRPVLSSPSTTQAPGGRGPWRRDPDQAQSPRTSQKQ